MSPFDVLVSAVLTLVLHATVLLGAAWLAERLGALRHAGWAEFAWRGALFLALVSTSVQVGRLLTELARAPTSPSTPSALAGVAPASSAPPRADVAASSDAVSSTVADRVVPATPTAPASAPVTASAPIATASARTLVLPDIVGFAALAAWLLALAIGALRLAIQALAIGRLARRARHDGRPAPPALHADLEQAAAVFGVGVPSLRLLDGLASPLLMPGRRLLLPAWVPALPADQRRALLAHELAHLQRGDPAWRVLQRLAALPLCFHPLAWHALARLDALAEDACDARAARLAGSGRPLAECLAACLTHSHARRAPVLAVAMADRPGPVVRRVKNLLEDPPMSDRPASPVLRRAALVLGITLAIAVPGLAVTTYAAHAFGDSLVGQLQLDGKDHFRYRSQSGDYRLQMDITGQVEFNDAETDVVRLGKGARLVLAEDKDGVERELRVFGKGGVIQREFRVDGDIVPFADGGRAWLATMLPTLMRETGVDVEGRSQRILARGGTPALLTEIGLIQSDHSRARYLGELFARAPLDEAQTRRALALATAIESDFELRQALQAAIAAPSFEATKLPLVLDAAATIGSDFERAELLSSIAEDHAIAAAALPAWKKAFAGFGSDFERGRVLEALLDRGQPTPATVVLALDGALGIQSDFELKQVLQEAAPHAHGDAGATAAWFRAFDGLQSDFERRESLKAMLEADAVDLALADAVLRAVGTMQSDFEAGEVLEALAARMPDDAGLRERYRAVARRLGDFERGKAEKALDRFAAN